MQTIYNSNNYAVVEFSSTNEQFPQHAGGIGFEIVDKNTRREIFIGGLMAEQFRVSVQALIETEPSVEDIDEFLGRFDSIMHQPVTLH